MSHDHHNQVEEQHPPKLYGVIAEFETPHSLIEAARAVQTAGYTKYECYSPHPVHGIDQAMKTPYSPIPWLVLGGGVSGFFLAFLMQCWMNGWDYRYIISGKPFFSIPAQIPVAFELTILLAGITAFVGMLLLNKLFSFYSPLNKNKTMQRVTNDKYALVIEADDAQFRLQGTSELLNSAGAHHLEACYEEHQTDSPPMIFWQVIVLLVAVGLVPMALVFKSSFSASDEPPIRIDHGMAYQQKVKAQQKAPEGVFMHPEVSRNESNRPPVEGAIQFGSSINEEFNKGKSNGQFITGFPETLKGKLDDKMMARGQRQFGIYCSVCHGAAGYGDGMVHRVATERMLSGDASMWVAPKSIHDPLIASKPNGEIFDTITNGKNNMMGYGYRITPEDRWAIVLYVRALQRSQGGKLVEAKPANTPPTTVSR
ncbi:MAG TPA: DUF3341 domain-containing protein [Gemmatales bacterium]|nr:DUF3341 domain-containing protein [Gemmatales bacterium]